MEATTNSSYFSSEQRPVAAADGEVGISEGSQDDTANATSNKSETSAARGGNNRTQGNILAMRCLVTTKEAGLVIGRAGKNIADIRAQSGARVMISEITQGAYERIVTISGTVETIAKVKAL